MQYSGLTSTLWTWYEWRSPADESNRRNTLSASSILGLISDAHLSTKEFNTLASAFFIGRSRLVLFERNHLMSSRLSSFSVATELGFTETSSWEVVDLQYILMVSPVQNPFNHILAYNFIGPSSSACIRSATILRASVSIHSILYFKLVHKMQLFCAFSLARPKVARTLR